MHTLRNCLVKTTKRLVAIQPTKIYYWANQILVKTAIILLNKFGWYDKTFVVLTKIWLAK